MKKSDWALVVLIVVIVGVASYFVVDAILPSPGANPDTVKTAEEISTSITEPDKSIFGEDAINPALKVTIGDQSGQQPFTPGSE